ASLPAFMKDLLTTQAVVVAGTEAAAFLVERQGENFGLRLIHHIRPDESDQETRANAVRAFQNIIQPCVAQRKDGAIEIGSPDGGDAQFCLITVLRNEGEVVAASAVITRCRDMERAKQRLQSMQLVAGYFDLFSMRRYIEHARQTSERHQHVLQYAGAVATAEGFESSAMNLCNELATRSGATRVALGWVKGKNIKVKALSHTEKFDKKQELVIALEKVMEECLDQEEPVRFDPEGNSSQNVTRSAREHSLKQGGNIVMSIPLRRRDEIVGVLTMEFPPRIAVDGQGETGLAVASELLAPQLFDRYENDRNIVVKIGHSIKNVAKLAIGPKHMGVKLIIAAVLALGTFVALYKPMYRVRASFQFQPVEKRSICPPYDGSIEKVFFKPGDSVKKGELLAQMRTIDKKMQLGSALDQVHRWEVEAAKASAEGKGGERQIARFQMEQYQKEADLLKYQISQADLVAPFDGVLMKGDLYDRQGAPAKLGDVLFEIAKTEEGHADRIAVEAEIQVSERDIQEVRKFAFNSSRPIDGELSTTSFPDRDHQFKITRIVPLGVPKEGENVFQVFADIPKAEPWMHPGLAGEARVEIEKRRLVWIWTHRLTDWLRLKLWI
ncbi:MAG TPA: HlyD family efflux transporter periplasmic adaptor subunit, partial [Tepidisphaeraceae bacterium]|nr:HlyD family efflux transporter periplasmic adaptor subunit [Tepidisphaeraceae bacterium]